MHPEPKNDTEADLARGAPRKKGGKKNESDGSRERETNALSSTPHFSSSSPAAPLSEGLEQASVRRQPTFRGATTGFPRHFAGKPAVGGVKKCRLFSQNRAEITFLVYEQTPYPIWFCTV